MKPIEESSHPTSFATTEIDAALRALADRGYCVIREMIDQGRVDELKASIDRALDPERDLPVASNHYHMAFAEVSRPLWGLAVHEPFMEYAHRVHGTTDLCLHRSAAILRTPGEPMGDHRGKVNPPIVPNDVLNRFPMPSGSWFYLNGSAAGRSGIAVIERSHLPGWKGPDGFKLTRDSTSFTRIDGPDDEGCQDMDVPGCVPVTAAPGDLICFAANTFHANRATHERRYSCGFSFRPMSVKIDAPWPLPESAVKMIDALPGHLKHFGEGYTGYDGAWRGVL